MLTVILTGGSSRRMGRDKAMLPVSGESMALWLARKYEALGPVAFSVDRRGRFPVGTYRELEDRYPGCGPLNGLVSAFLETGEDIVFLTATDMPAGDPAEVRYLLERLGEHDACLFENEPLFGVYRRSCLEAARSCLEEKRFSLRGFLERVDALRVPVRCPAMLANLNTPEEYESYVRPKEQAADAAQ